MRGFMLALALVGLVAGAARRAEAGVIYDNGSPDLEGAYVSDYNFVGVGIETADDFQLAADATLRDVHWWGVYGTQAIPLVDDFTILVFNDDGGVPAATAFYSFSAGNAVNRVDTGLDIGVVSLFEYSVDVTDLPLTAGETYWLAIVNNSAPGAPSWHWATSDNLAGNAQQRGLDDGTWVNLPAELAFFLTDDQVVVVPEPTTFALAGIGGFGLAAMARRRRRAL